MNTEILKKELQKRIADNTDVLIKNTILELMLKIIEANSENDGTENGGDNGTPINNDVALVYKIKNVNSDHIHIITLTGEDILTLLTKNPEPEITGFEYLPVTKTSTETEGHTHNVTFYIFNNNFTIYCDNITSSFGDNTTDERCYPINANLMAIDSLPNRGNVKDGDILNPGVLISGSIFYKAEKFTNNNGENIGKSSNLYGNANAINGEFYGFNGKKVIRLHQPTSIVTIKDVKRVLDSDSNFRSIIYYDINHKNNNIHNTTLGLQRYIQPGTDEREQFLNGGWDTIESITPEGINMLAVDVLLEPSDLIRIIDYNGNFENSDIFGVPFQNNPVNLAFVTDFVNTSFNGADVDVTFNLAFVNFYNRDVVKDFIYILAKYSYLDENFIPRTTVKKVSLENALILDSANGGSNVKVTLKGFQGSTLESMSVYDASGYFNSSINYILGA